MIFRLRSLLLPALLVCTCLATAAPAAAHPMGNFSINHFAAITVAPDRVRLLYVVDMAEIPTFQELNGLGVAGQDSLSPGRRAAYLQRKAQDLAGGLSVTFAGRRVPLRLQADDLLFPPGAGGLPTERVYLALEGHLPGRPGTLRYRDGNFPGRAGWKEIVWAARGVALHNAAPANRSRFLTVYPSGIVNSPPQDVAATLPVALRSGTASLARMPSPAAEIRKAEAPLFGPGGGWSGLARGLTRVRAGRGGRGGVSGSGTSWAAGRLDGLSSLMGHRQLSLGVMLLSLLVAFWFGAGHALSPGHGKTIVAAYLVGSRGTAAQAVVLGATVTVTHTAGVFALGLVTLYLSRYVVPDQLYPWLGFISGLLVASMGLTLFVRRLRALRSVERSRTPAAHTHVGHDRPDQPHVHWHDHGDGHVHAHLHPSAHVHDHSPEAQPHRHGIFGRAHTHAAPHLEGEKVTVRSLIGLGVSGGLLPCPSALVVLLSAIAFHQVAFGMVLIVAFSLGLATTLTGIGLLVVYGRRALARLLRDGDALGRVRRLAPALRALPVLSALVVAALGALIALGAVGGSALPTLLTQL